MTHILEDGPGDISGTENPRVLRRVGITVTRSISSMGRADKVAIQMCVVCEARQSDYRSLE
jgi:hypothetical protein